MININFPPYEPRIKKEEDASYIFDEVRKQWVTLTPEEWVRQNFLQYIIRVENYPSSLIAVEKTIYLGELKKRFDIVVYDRKSLPWMIIECKEMNISLNQTVMEQVMRYNIHLRAPFFVITNGNQCIAYEYEKDQLRELSRLPSF